MNRLVLVTMIFWTTLSWTHQLLADECRRNSDCPDNHICVVTSSGERICIWNNNQSCDGNGDCPTGSECILGTCSDGNPGDSCESNGDCQTSYVCCDNRCVESRCERNEASDFSAWLNTCLNSRNLRGES